MKNRMLKSIISIFLVLVMVMSMFTVSFTSVFATHTDVALTSGVGTNVLKAVGAKLLTQGKRKLCDLTLQLGESLGGEAEKKVEAFSKWFLMDAAEAAAYDAKQLCYEILDELVLLEGKITDYTSDLAGMIDSQNAKTALSNFNEKWGEDVDGVMNGKYNNSGNVLAAFDAYFKYFLVTQLNEQGLPEDASEKAALNKLWEDIGCKSPIKESDISEEACADAKAEVDDSFAFILSATGDSEHTYFYSARVNEEFSKAIMTLSNNLTYTSLSNNDSELTCVESAAVYADLALPFSDQQYEFVSSCADKQSLVIMILNMTYNEFLAQQGEYLQSYFEENPPEKGEWNEQKVLYRDSAYLSYNDLEESAERLLEYSGEEISKLYDSKLDVSYASSVDDVNFDYDMTLAHYMSSKDAVVDTLTIDGFENSHNYKSELQKENSYSHIDNNSHITDAKYTSENMDFYRVMAGNMQKEVYYILSPEQFKDGSDATAIGIVDHNVSRGETELVDLYGNIHLTSCDYRNLIKNIKDGTNTFSCPTSSEISGTSGSLSALLDTAAFSFYGFEPTAYLSKYAPQKRASNTFILTSTYKHNYDGGAAIPKYADISLVNADKNIGINKEITTDWYNFEDIKLSADGRNHSYILVVENNSDAYLQSAYLSAKDDAEFVESFEIVNGGNYLKQGEILSGETALVSTLGKTAVIRPGNNITLRFKLLNDKSFVSLKAVRHNKTETEEVLIDSLSELECFEKTVGGYYEFEYNMPYSNVEFVLETKQILYTDEEGNYIIKSYEDLVLMSEKVNAGIEEYVNGSYILANDITVSENDYWNAPIGTSSVKFAGSFDGQGYKISGLKSNKPAEYDFDSVVDNSNMGLFGWVRDAEIKNICLENVDFSTNDDIYSVAYVGALCARAEGDNTFTKCIASGSMNFAKASGVGGLIGACIAGNNSITNCANQINITVDSGYICGGIAGSCDGKTAITNCYSVGEINGSFRTCSVINGSMGKIANCYVLDNVNYMVYSGTTMCTIEQFKSGEVAHLLNKTLAIPSWAWFQNLDNGKTPDEFPTLKFTRDNVVFKVNREDKAYSNIPNDYLVGDTNLDGNVTILDATIIQKHCAKLYEMVGTSLVNADTTRDNTISVSDATKIQGYIAGFLEEL